MRYIKNFNNFLLFEKKQTYNWSAFFSQILDYINIERSKNKVEQLLARDVLNNSSLVLDADDKKIFSQSSTEKKFSILMQYKYNPDMVGKYAGDLTSIKDAVLSGDDISHIKTFKELIDFADEWHDKQEVIVSYERTDENKDTDKFITYPDGWYWINLNTSYSADEASNMGHCGQDSGKILFSLRDDEKQSHITVSYDNSKHAIYQIKGRKNTKPKQIYHHNIIDLLLNDKYPINIISTGAYKPELDFSISDLTEKEKNELYEIKPGLKYTSEMFELAFKNDDISTIISMCSNGYLYDGYRIARFWEAEQIVDLIGIIENHKIKNIAIIKNILESCCDIKPSFAKEWSIDVLVYFKKAGVKCVGTPPTDISLSDIEKLMTYIGYVPSTNDLRSLVSDGRTDVLLYIVSKIDKIDFDASYYNNLCVESNDLDLTKLGDIFHFDEFSVNLNRFLTNYSRFSEKTIQVSKNIIQLKKHSEWFLVSSVRNVIDLLNEKINESVFNGFREYAKLFNFTHRMYQKIFQEYEYASVEINDVVHLTTLFYVSEIIDLQTAYDTIKTVTNEDRYRIAAKFSVNNNLSDEILDYLVSCEDITFVMGIIESDMQHDNELRLIFDVPFKMYEKFHKEFTNDFILTQAFSRLYKVIKNVF